MKSKKVLLILSLMLGLSGIALTALGCQGHKHEFTEWQQVTPVTCTQDGTISRSCKTCDEVETATVAKTGHDFSGPYVQTQTHHYHLCKNGCGTIEGEEEHVFTGGSTVCDICHFDKGSADVLAFAINHEDGTCSVTGFYGDNKKTDIVIPDTYYGIPVTKIEAKAFSKSATGISLTSVTLGKNIKDIADQAFYSNDLLDTIAFPESVQTIGKWTFSGCTSLKNVTFSEGLQSIEYCAFQSCKMPDTVIFPRSLKRVGSYAFYDCSDLAHATFQNVEYLADCIFSSCTALTCVDLGDGDLVLEDYALAYCSALNKVTVGDNVRVFGQNVFWNSGDVECYSDGGINYIGNEQNHYVVAMSTTDKSLRSYTSKPQTRIIAQSAFSDCTMLENVEIGDNVQMICREAFSGCSGLQNLKLGAVKKIGVDAFSGCHIGQVEVDTIEDWLNICFYVNEVTNQLPYHDITSPLGAQQLCHHKSRPKTCLLLLGRYPGRHKDYRRPCLLWQALQRRSCHS